MNIRTFTGSTRHWAQALPVWILCSLVFLAPAAPGQNTQNTTPGLTAEHFPLSLTRKAGLTRAEEAIKAARLDVLPPTEISRGGTSPRVNALIHCIDTPGGILVDVTVANVAGLEYAGEALRSFLSAFMKTGHAPNAGTPATGTDFSGEWDTRAGVSYRIRFTQTGNRVTGTYEGGEIEGTVMGNVLRFRWKQTNGNKGAGKFTLSADRKSFAGVWTYGDDPDTATNSWNGTRIGPPPGNTPSGGGIGNGVPQSPQNPPAGDGFGAAGTAGGRKPSGTPPDPTRVTALASIEKTAPTVPFNAIKVDPPRLPNAGTDHLNKGMHGATLPSNHNRSVHILKIKASPEFADSDRKDSPHYLKVEIDLSEPLDGDGMVEVYVGGYITAPADYGYCDAYEVKCAFPVGKDEAAGIHYTVIFDMPDALPCPIRAEITASNSDTVVDSYQTKFTFPFPEYSLSKGPVWCELGENLLRGIYLGIDHGALPPGATMRAGTTIFYKKGTPMEFKGYAFQGTDEMFAYNRSELSAEGVLIYANKHLSPETDWNSMLSEARCLRSDGSYLRPLDKRRCQGYNTQPNGGFDTTRLLKRVSIK